MLDCDWCWTWTEPPAFMPWDPWPPHERPPSRPPTLVQSQPPSIVSFPADTPSAAAWWLLALPPAFILWDPPHDMSPSRPPILVQSQPPSIVPLLAVISPVWWLLAPPPKLAPPPNEWEPEIEAEWWEPLELE